MSKGVHDILKECFNMYVLKSEGNIQEGFSTDLSFSFKDEIYCNVVVNFILGLPILIQISKMCVIIMMDI